MKCQDLMARRTTIVLASAIVAALLMAWRVIRLAFLRVGGFDKVSVIGGAATVTWFTMTQFGVYSNAYRGCMSGGF